MPPKKAKLYKSEKRKTSNKPQRNEVSNTAGHSGSSPTEPDRDIFRQFELELAWCIQTMESSLNGGKLNPNQGLLARIVILAYIYLHFCMISVRETTQNLNILKSSNQPMIRKRQIMRLSFGDYRAKMAEEEKRLRLGLYIF